MGNGPSGMPPGGVPPRDGSRNGQQKKKKYEPPPAPTRVGRKKKRRGPEAASKLPTITPTAKCRLRLQKLDRVKDYLALEEYFVTNQERFKPREEKVEEERSKVDDLRGSPMSVGSLEEIIDDDHAIVSSAVGPEFYVYISSFVDKDLLEPGCSVLLHHKLMSIVGVLADDADPMVSVMKVDKAPLESYADIGGLETQIQEIKEAVELPLTHPELYEDIGIKPPKGVILYGEPGTGKTLLAKAVANSTSATFLRVVGSELIQKYLGDGPKLVRELFRVAEEMAPSIVFIDEIDAVGTKRYDTTSGGEREIQRTMLELLNQLDGFDSRGDVKVLLATNRIESLDPALLRPGRIDRKIEFPLPDEKTKRRIFTIHTGRMTLATDVNLEEFIMSKDNLSGADIKAICTEAGLMALRERRMKVMHADFKKARENVLYKKNEGVPEGLYLSTLQSILGLGHSRHCGQLHRKMPRMKRAYRGLYGNRMIQFGNKVSFAENKTRRTWKPNVHRLSFYSEAMDRVYRFRITTHALRDVRKFGGIDEYLVRTRDTEIKFPAAIRLKQCVKIIRASKQLPKDTAIPQFHIEGEHNAVILERLPSEQTETNRVGLQHVL